MLPVTLREFGTYFYWNNLEPNLHRDTQSQRRGYVIYMYYVDLRAISYLYVPVEDRAVSRGAESTFVQGGLFEAVYSEAYRL